ncbi:unnamed protein product, partial [Brenthis ino]
MPCLKVLTNIPKSKIPKDFFSKIIPVLSEGVRKAPEHFLCAVEGDCLLSINGNTELPAAIATLESIGNLGPEDNKKIVKLLSSFLQKEIGVQPDRFFLTFYDLEDYNVAKNGITIASKIKEMK